MHRAQAVASSVFAARSTQVANSVALNSSQANALAGALRQDAADATYSAAFSICEAVQALDRKMYTWSTVKLYYSTFYLARASLGLGGVGLIYVKTTPYVWQAAAGHVPKKSAGTTHKATLAAFATHRASSPLLSQLIVADAPLDWLAALRESVNYKVPKFVEPNVPEHFKFVDRHGVRRMVTEYLADSSNRYTFDPDHAMLAFPIAALKETLTQLKAVTGAGLSPADSAFVTAQCCDKQGPIAEMRRLLQA